MNPSDESRVIEMAWEDRTPFEAIQQLYGMSEPEVIRFMRKSLKPGSREVSRGYCPTQYKQR